MNNKKILCNGKETEFSLLEKDENFITILYKEKRYSFELKGEIEGKLILSYEGRNYVANWSNSLSSENENEWFFNIAGKDTYLKYPERSLRKNAAENSGGLKSPMPGKVFKIVVNIGDKVKKGQVLMILEAMKMEHSIRSPEDGVVTSIYFKAGEQVTGGVKLMDVKGES